MKFSKTDLLKKLEAALGSPELPDTEIIRIAKFLMKYDKDKIIDILEAMVEEGNTKAMTALVGIAEEDESEITGEGFKLEAAE